MPALHQENCLGRGGKTGLDSVALLWAPGKASLSLGVLTWPVWLGTPLFGVTRHTMVSCQASGDAPGIAKSWYTAGAASPASPWGAQKQTLRQEERFPVERK